MLAKQLQLTWLHSPQAESETLLRLRGSRGSSPSVCRLTAPSVRFGGPNETVSPEFPSRWALRDTALWTTPSLPTTFDVITMEAPSGLGGVERGTTNQRSGFTNDAQGSMKRAKLLLFVYIYYILLHSSFTFHLKSKQNYVFELYTVHWYF